MSTLLKHGLAIVVALLCQPICSACSRCQGERAPTGASLEWETVRLGVDIHGFRKAAAQFAGIDAGSAESMITCSAQTELAVIDLEENAIVDRAAGGHALENCLLELPASERHPSLMLVRAEFVDSRLVKVSYRFAPGRRDSLATALTGRFGDGEEVSLEERSIFDQRATTATLWHAGNEIWALFSTGEGADLVVRQDRVACGTLPSSTGAEGAEKGKPVSLDDLGIGKLDLNAPLPEVPEVRVSDSGP